MIVYPDTDVVRGVKTLEELEEELITHFIDEFYYGHRLDPRSWGELITRAKARVERDHGVSA